MRKNPSNLNISSDCKITLFEFESEEQRESWKVVGNIYEGHCPFIFFLLSHPQTMKYSYLFIFMTEVIAAKVSMKI